MNETNKNERTNNIDADTVTIPRPTHWEIQALEDINERYWDEHVLACESWDEARDHIAIDGLLNSLLAKLERAAGPAGCDDDWPLQDEDRIRNDWIESGGSP